MDNVTLTGVRYQQSSAIHCVSEFGIGVSAVPDCKITSKVIDVIQYWLA